MTTKQKAQIIGAIMSHLRFAAKKEQKCFPEGDTFFALAFSSDSELQKIAKLCGA